MSKTLLCHTNTPAALKCVSAMELTKPQKECFSVVSCIFALGSMLAASGKSVKVVPEVIQGIKSAEDFVSDIAVTHLN